MFCNCWMMACWHDRCAERFQRIVMWIGVFSTMVWLVCAIAECNEYFEFIENYRRYGRADVMRVLGNSMIWHDRCIEHFVRLIGAISRISVTSSKGGLIVINVTGFMSALIV